MNLARPKFFSSVLVNTVWYICQYKLNEGLDWSLWWYEYSVTFLTEKVFSTLVRGYCWNSEGHQSTEHYLTIHRHWLTFTTKMRVTSVNVYIFMWGMQWIAPVCLLTADLPDCFRQVGLGRFKLFLFWQTDTFFKRLQNHKKLSNQSTKGNCPLMLYCGRTWAESVSYNIKQQIWNTMVKSINKIYMCILSTNFFLSHYLLPF